MNLWSFIFENLMIFWIINRKIKLSYIGYKHIIYYQFMDSQSKDFDLVVVGAGVFGLSTCIYIAMHHPQLKFALV